MPQKKKRKAEHRPMRALPNNRVIKLGEKGHGGSGARWDDRQKLSLTNKTPLGSYPEREGGIAKVVSKRDPYYTSILSARPFFRGGRDRAGQRMRGLPTGPVGRDPDIRKRHMMREPTPEGPGRKSHRVKDSRSWQAA